MERFDRLKLLIGENGLDKLNLSNVLIFGLGGVGGFAAESLVRSGIGRLTVVDGDVVEKTNFNRQLLANSQTLGKFKVDVAKERFLKINPNLKITTLAYFYSENNSNLVNLNEFDYVVDAIDDLNVKILLAHIAFKLNVNIITALSAGNKFDATKLKVGDLFETSGCPLAKKMRSQLKQRGVDRLKVVWSTELPLIKSSSSNFIGSNAFVPAVMGLLLANEVVKSLI